MFKEFETHLVEIPSYVWLAVGFLPLLAVIFILDDFPWFIAVPPGLVTVICFVLFVWAQLARRRRN